MVADEPYDLMPHRALEDLKKQVNQLKSKSEKSSSQAIVNSLDKLTISMDSMLRLFEEAAKEVKIEEKDESSIPNQLRAIIEQNKIIAEGMVTVSDMVKEFIEHHGHRPAPRPSFPPHPEPHFQPPRIPEPNLQPPRAPPPNFEHLPPIAPKAPGPVAMPAMPFPDLDEKPKKKGLFGRLKR
tara:strand:- start:642 stop:1187 length:546 start_codon:yes stop_codon:yes gene_type:complete